MAYDKTKEAIEKLPGELQETASAYLKDIEYWDSKVAALQKCETYQIDPNNPKRQRKLPAHDLLKEAQQQKVNLQRALTVLFKKNIADEEEEFDRWIKGESDEQ